MRKESRAMDSGWALEVMHKAPYITVSFIDDEGKPYGLPLSLASDDDMNWYFHGALEGKKLEAIKAHSEVCLSAVTRCAPTVGPKDGSFTLQYKSAIAFGKAEIVTEDFIYPRDKHNHEYGWGWSLLNTPEDLYGREACQCNRTPQVSYQRIFEHLKEILPDASDKQIIKLIG